MVCLLVTGTGLTLHGQKWSHRVLVRDATDIQNSIAFLTNSGHAFHMARVSPNRYWHMYVDDYDYSGALLGDVGSGTEDVNPTDEFVWRGGPSSIFVGPNNYSDATLAGTGYSVADLPGVKINSRGEVVFSAVDAGHKNADMFVGSVNYTKSLLGEKRGAYAAALADDGTPIWRGSGSVTRGITDVFYGTTNISMPLLGGHRDMQALAGASNGNFCWEGTGDSFGQIEQVFQGSVSLTEQVFGRNGWGILRDIADDGAAVWQGGDFGAGVSDIYLGTKNVSQGIMGVHPQYWRVRSKSGRTAWNGQTEDGHTYGLYLEQENLISWLDKMVPFNFMLNSLGKVVYEALPNPQAGDVGLYLDRYDIAAGYRGVHTSQRYAYLLAFNDSNQVLWGDYDWTTDRIAVILSTPVPEPFSWIVVAVGAGPFLARRRVVRPRR